MSPEEIAEKFIKIEHKHIDDKEKQFKLSHTILTSNASIAEDVTAIKKHQDKHSLIVMGMVGLACFTLGLTVNSWIPYANTVYDTVKTVQKVIPKG